jgi:hypothetical protein
VLLQWTQWRQGHRWSWRTQRWTCKCAWWLGMAESMLSELKATGGYTMSLMEVEPGTMARWEEGLRRKEGCDAFSCWLVCWMLLLALDELLLLCRPRWCWTCASAVVVVRCWFYWILDLATLCSLVLYWLPMKLYAGINHLCLAGIRVICSRFTHFLSSSWLLQVYVYVCCDSNARH